MTRHEYIALGMPLPVDVFATLGDLINKAWPDAQIITDPVGAGVPEDVRRNLGFGWGGARGATLVRIDTTRAAKKVSKKAAQEARAANERPEDAEDEDTVHITAPLDSEGRFSLSMPERLMHALAPIIESILTNEAGPNYAEMPVRTAEHGTAVMIVARSEAQTPHALHMAAKAENAQLRALLSETLSFVESSAAPEDLDARVAAALGDTDD